MNWTGSTGGEGKGRNIQEDYLKLSSVPQQIMSGPLLHEYVQSGACCSNFKENLLCDTSETNWENATLKYYEPFDK